MMLEHTMLKTAYQIGAAEAVKRAGLNNEVSNFLDALTRAAFKIPPHAEAVKNLAEQLRLVNIRGDHWPSAKLKQDFSALMRTIGSGTNKQFNHAVKDIERTHPRYTAGLRSYIVGKIPNKSGPGDAILQGIFPIGLGGYIGGELDGERGALTGSLTGLGYGIARHIGLAPLYRRVNRIRNTADFMEKKLGIPLTKSVGEAVLAHPSTVKNLTKRFNRNALLSSTIGLSAGGATGYGINKFIPPETNVAGESLAETEA